MIFIDWLKRNYPNENEWENIKHITCKKSMITSLEGIENLINLETLDCSYNRLKSLKGIENLTKLIYLECNDNQLTSLKQINNLINLKYIFCDSNKLISLKGIENLSKLETIQFQHNGKNLPPFYISIKDLKKEIIKEHRINIIKKLL